MNPISNIKTKTISLEKFKAIFVLNIQGTQTILSGTYLEMLININSRNDIVLNMKTPGIIGNFCQLIFKDFYMLDFDKNYIYNLSLDSDNHIYLTYLKSRLPITKYIKPDNVKYITKIKVLVPEK